MLGNPNLITPGNDASTTDLLHCYTDSYVTLYNLLQPLGTQPTATALLNAADPCGYMGTYSTDDYPVTNPAAVPNDTNVDWIYCAYFLQDAYPGASPTSSLGMGFIDGCMGGLVNGSSNDVGHFSQYLLDTHVMNDYMDLTSNYD
jgi:hypothetical protein